MVVILTGRWVCCAYQLCKSMLIAHLDIPTRFLTIGIILVTLSQGASHVIMMIALGLVNWLRELQNAGTSSVKVNREIHPL